MIWLVAVGVVWLAGVVVVGRVSPREGSAIFDDAANRDAAAIVAWLWPVFLLWMLLCVLFYAPLRKGKP
jgi:hypothetical protein